MLTPAHLVLQVPVLYPFGHGLSYTTFAVRDMTAAPPLAHSGQPATLLHINFTIANTGSVGADEVALLFMQFAGIQQQPKRRRRWWLPAAVSQTQQSAQPEATLHVPCTSHGSAGTSVPPDLPLQTLVGFRRVHSLQPGAAAVVSLPLKTSHFVPFSPLTASEGTGQPDVQPYCGDYVLRAGAEELLVRLQGPVTSAAAW